MVFEVLFDTVVFPLHITAVEKAQDALFELAAALPADNLYLGELLVFGFLEGGIDLVSLVVNGVKVNGQATRLRKARSCEVTRTAPGGNSRTRCRTQGQGLFEMLTGKVTPDSGSITMRKGTTLGHLEQEVNALSERPLLEDVAMASTRITWLAHRIEVLQTALAEEGTDEENLAEMLHELGELQHEFEAAGGYDAEHEARIVLSGLGFKESDFYRPLAEFSGGWQMRAALAKFRTQDIAPVELKGIVCTEAPPIQN